MLVSLHNLNSFLNCRSEENLTLVTPHCGSNYLCIVLKSTLLPTLCGSEEKLSNNLVQIKNWYVSASDAFLKFRTFSYHNMYTIFDIPECRDNYRFYPNNKKFEKWSQLNFSIRKKMPHISLCIDNSSFQVFHFFEK